MSSGTNRESAAYEYAVGVVTQFKEDLISGVPETLKPALAVKLDELAASLPDAETFQNPGKDSQLDTSRMLQLYHEFIERLAVLDVADLIDKTQGREEWDYDESMKAVLEILRGALDMVILRLGVKESPQCSSYEILLEEVKQNRVFFGEALMNLASESFDKNNAFTRKIESGVFEDKLRTTIEKIGEQFPDDLPDKKRLIAGFQKAISGLPLFFAWYYLVQTEGLTVSESLAEGVKNVCHDLDNTLREANIVAGRLSEEKKLDGEVGPLLNEAYEVSGLLQAISLIPSLQ